MALLALGHKVQAQQNEIIGALAALNGKINVRFSIVDSLHPFTAKGLTELQKDFVLSRQEIAEIKRVSKRSTGMKLGSSFIEGARLFSSVAFYKAYQSADSLSLSFIEKNKPFYIMSVPLFFSNGQKATIDVDLIGSGGYTYLLVKKKDKWIIEKDFVRWVE